MQHFIPKLTGKVLIIGDSITLGALEVSNMQVARWVDRCYVEELKEEFPQVEFVIDAVINRSTDNVRPLISSLLETHNPDVVLLAISGGDVDVHWRRFIVSNGRIAQSIVPRKRYAKNMRQIISEIVASGAYPILTDIMNHDLTLRGPYLSAMSGRNVSEMIEREGGQARSNLEFLEYRKLIQQIAAETGGSFVDYNTPFAKHPRHDILSSDGLHPTQLAHDLIAAAISQVLVRVLHERVNSVVPTGLETGVAGQ